MENLKLENERVELQERKVKFSGIFKNPIMIKGILSTIFMNPYMREMALFIAFKRRCNDIKWLKENLNNISKEIFLNDLLEYQFGKGMLLNDNADEWITDMEWLNISNNMYDELFGTFEWAH